MTTHNASGVPVLGALVSLAESERSVAGMSGTCADLGVPLIVDSGAWSVFTGSSRLDLDTHSKRVGELAVEFPNHRFVGFDVIGDPEQTRRNWASQRDLDLPVEPTIHFGSDPEAVDWYLSEGLATPWVNLGGLVQYNSRTALAPKVASWCAAVMRRLPEGVKVHGLGCTSPALNRYLPFDSVDSIYWKMSLVRFRNVPLFDPAKRSGWRILKSASTTPAIAENSRRVALRNASWLRANWGLSPGDLLGMGDQDLQSLLVSSHMRMARYMRGRHGSNLTLHLAGVSPEELTRYHAEEIKR